MEYSTNIKNLKIFTKLVALLAGIACIWLFNLQALQSKDRLDQALTGESSYSYQFLTQQINAANETILQDRRRITALYNNFLQHKPIGIYNLIWLYGDAYGNTSFFNPYDSEEWDAMLNAVDVIPTKVVLEQAMLNSQNGTSAIAQHANNFFNIIVDRAEFGWRGALIPPAIHELNWLEPNDIQYANYATSLQSVSDYMWQLNTAARYSTFRKLRAQRRQKNLSIVDWNASELIPLTQPSPYATDSLYGNNSLPPIPYAP